LQHLGIKWDSDEQLQEILGDLDEDGSGEVSFAELLEVPKQFFI
jgi:Ca2+-binding EF-hand superfamily protein